MQRGMDALGTAVFWARPEDGRIVYGNRAALTLFGCSEQELLSWRMPDIDATFRGGGWCEHISELQQSRTLERQTILLDATQQPLLVDLDSSVVAMDSAG